MLFDLRLASSHLDIEKGADVNEPFDLREYLSSSNDANEAAGIKHKHVGVTWEDLEVEVVGSADMKVKFSSRLVMCFDTCYITVLCAHVWT